MPRHPLPRIAVAALLGLVAATPAVAAGYDADVTRDQYGIPHIVAEDFGALAYGYGKSFAEDNLCVIAESYVTVNAQRSRFFGPEAGYASRGNGSSANNLNSDFFYQRIIDDGRIERLVAQEPPLGPKPEIEQALAGYVAGYNEFLESVGGTGAPDYSDPACRGKEWVRPITLDDVYRRFYQLTLLASSGVAIDGIASAMPLATTPSLPVAALKPGVIDERLGGLGSNAVGLGADATESGNGMLYGNPHFPWEGPERFYQARLTIPGELDVSGGSLFGVPIVLIGSTKGLAWSHTVSTARRFTPFELRLVPGDPTTYLVDGQPRKMKAETVTVQARTAAGTLESRSRTLYSSHHGPILTGILGLPIFPWTPERAYALGDANEDNFGRLLNHFFDTNQAQSVDELDGILKKYVGIPWVNTVAADTQGKAYYADIGSIPNVSASKLATCQPALGIALDQYQRLPVLDGSRSDCEWDMDADAPAPGIFGPGNLPSLERQDYTSNMNDSFWLTNPREPLEGFSRIIGDERTTRSLRTRGGIVLVEEELAAKRGFTLDTLTEKSMSNRVPAWELFRTDALAMCDQLPSAPTSSGALVATAAPCAALRAWNGRDDLDAKGAVLGRRFLTKALAATGGAFVVPFNVNDPVNTPRGLNTAHPQVRTALGDAIADLDGAKIPYDAGLRGYQYELRGEHKMPIHGGPGGTGVFNVISAGWNSKLGFPDVNHGSSFVQAVELGEDCAEQRTILTYSQSTNPNSPHYADQTELYADKGWVTTKLC